MIAAAAIMILNVKEQIESNGIESAENAVQKAENLLTTDILADKSAVTRFGGYIDWNDKEDAINTMRSFIKEYSFAYAIYLDGEGEGYDQNGKPQSTESLPSVSYTHLIFVKSSFSRIFSADSSSLRQAGK